VICRSNKEPVVVFGHRAERYVVGVSALDDNHNSDPDDFKSQRDVENTSRKFSVIFCHHQTQDPPRQRRADELTQELQWQICQSIGKLVSIVVFEVPVEVPMVNRVHF